jgi:predicted ATP-grasp superfamily ATP-dependent carboligase
MELELVRDANNEFYLIEINPRIPAWVYLAVGAGQNIPEALVKLALGMPVEPYTTYDVGKMFIRYSYDMIVDLKEFEALTTKGEYLEVRSSEFGVRSSEFGVRSSEFGVRSSEFGVRSSEFGVRSLTTDPSTLR